MTRQKRLGLITIISIALLQLIGVGMSPMLAEMSSAFPDASEASIQFVITLPNLFVIFVSLIAARLSSKIPNKYLTAFGGCLVICFVILGFAFHQTLFSLYCWSAIMGIGIGFMNVVGTIIINEMYDDNERVQILGYQAFAGAMGTMLLTFICSMLITKEWYFGYLAYLIVIPSIFLSLLALPRDTKISKDVKTSSTKDSEKTPWHYKCFPVLVAFAFNLIYLINSNNLAMLITENGLGSSSQAGTMISITMIFGGFVGLVVGKITDKLGNATLPFAFGIVFIGYLVIYFSQSLLLILIGSILNGCAICLVMPNVIAIASRVGGENANMWTTLTLMGSYAGGLISPILTNVTSVVFHSDFVGYRYVFGAIIEFVFMILLIIYIVRFYRKSRI